MPLKYIAVIGLGGGLGSILRWLVSKYFNPMAMSHFPWGTLFVNFTGCFLIGILAELLTREPGAETTKLFWISGFLGGFTTFSAFSLEGVALLTGNQVFLGLAYIVLTLAGTLSATWGGLALARAIL